MANTGAARWERAKREVVARKEAKGNRPTCCQAGSNPAPGEYTQPRICGNTLRKHSAENVAVEGRRLVQIKQRGSQSPPLI